MPDAPFSRDDLNRLWDRMDKIASATDSTRDQVSQVRVEIAKSTGEFEAVKTKVNLLLWFGGALGVAFISWLFGLLPTGGAE